jgi:hypothetical protein
MADLDITLRRKNGLVYDRLNPSTTWTQVEDKPTTFTPTAHTHTKANITDFAHSHGNITDTGTITADTAIASGQKFALVNGSNLVVRSALAFGSSTTTFLRNDGQWVTPAGGGTVTGTGTANLLTYWTGTSSIGSLATTTYPSLTELAYVKGVTSAIQTQLNGKAPTSHATSATTYGVGTDVNYGHVKGGKLNTTTDGEGGVSVISGTARATKTLRVNSVAQQTWGVLLNLTTTIGAGNLVRFVDLTISRTEGSITYYIGSIMVDVAGLATSTSTTPTIPGTSPVLTRWRLNTRNSSNTQLTLPIFMYNYTTDNTLRVYVDNSTAATYHYECVGYF